MSTYTSTTLECDGWMFVGEHSNPTKCADRMKSFLSSGNRATREKDIKKYLQSIGGYTFLHSKIRYHLCPYCTGKFKEDPEACLARIDE